jgi:hypothetical protein
MSYNVTAEVYSAVNAGKSYSSLTYMLVVERKGMFYWYSVVSDLGLHWV